MRAAALTGATVVVISAMIAGVISASAQVVPNPNKPAVMAPIETGPKGSVSAGATVSNNSVTSFGVGASSGTTTGTVYATPTGQVGVVGGKGNVSAGVETGPQGTSGSVNVTIPTGTVFK